MFQINSKWNTSLNVKAEMEAATVTHTCHHTIQKAEEGGSGVQGHPWLQGGFKANLSNVRPCVKNQN